MSLREDVELYTKLSGEDGSQETIATIGAYLRGYRQGKEDAEPHWIPVEQELPEQDEICLVCGKNGGIYVARFWRNENIVLWTKTGTGKFVNAVAWMPLPEPFKGVTE